MTETAVLGRRPRRPKTLVLPRLARAMGKADVTVSELCGEIRLDRREVYAYLRGEKASEEDALAIARVLCATVEELKGEER